MTYTLKHTFFALFLTTALLAAPLGAIAQDQLAPLPAGGKVLDTKEERVDNGDGTVTITRRVITEVENPDLPRPAGIPAHAKARNVTTVTTVVTQPADGKAIFYDGITEPLHLRGTPTAPDGMNVTRTITERQTVKIKNPDGTEDVTVNEVEKVYP